MKSLLSALCLSLGVTLAQAAAPALVEVVDTLAPSNALNVVTYSAPRAVSIAELGLDALHAGVAIMVADEIRIFASRDAMDASPKARLWRNAREGNRWWYQTGGVGSAEGHVVQPGEVIVVVTRASTQPIAWKNPLSP
ncbi:MAG TPA: hypothetical protein PKE12_07585 [Kiritimatiellia bacterium]|nr:hypothetical protein [Kiritimatiellia bacterium]